MACNHDYEQGGCGICWSADARNARIREENERDWERREALRRSPPPEPAPSPPPPPTEADDIMRDLAEEAWRGAGPDWDRYRNSGHPQTLVLASARHNMVLHLWSCARYLFLAVPDSKGGSSLRYFTSENHGHFYLRLPDRKLVPVYASDWWCNSSPLRCEGGIVQGPWWAHLRDVVIPEWRAYLDAEEDAAAQAQRAAGRKARADRAQELRSWRPG